LSSIWAAKISEETLPAVGPETLSSTCSATADS
jgi:hypothetical protein